MRRNGAKPPRLESAVTPGIYTARRLVQPAQLPDWRVNNTRAASCRAGDHLISYTCEEGVYRVQYWAFELNQPLRQLVDIHLFNLDGMWPTPCTALGSERGLTGFRKPPRYVCVVLTLRLHPGARRPCR